MCGLGSLYTVTQLVDFFEGGPGGVHTNARAWELHVAGAVPVLENSKVQIYFFQLMKLFDELSWHLRGVCTGTEHLEMLLKGGLCHLATGSCITGVFLQNAGNGQFLSLFHRNKHTYFPRVPWGRVIWHKEGVRSLLWPRIWIFTKMSQPFDFPHPRLAGNPM